MGFTDVYPFVLSLTQDTRTLATLSLAAAGMLIATVSNNIVKGFMLLDLLIARPGYRVYVFCWCLQLSALFLSSGYTRWALGSNVKVDLPDSFRVKRRFLIPER
ncbi:hypothetical protein [Edaphobacter sp.]|uniref:hypothetical protein n=1 Tax=Edaphobacter sp. TaxID=1934404 RepID=UPI0039C8A609